MDQSSNNTELHQDKVDPEGAEPKKKARVAEAQAKLATFEGKATRDEKETARNAGDKDTARKAGSTNVAILLHTDNERIKSWQVRCGNIDYLCPPYKPYTVYCR